VNNGTVVQKLWSREGVQQGDVLAGVLFSLGVHDNYLNALGSSDDVTGVAIMDDFNLEGPYTGVSSCL
jgi:hypothetical protein